MLLQDLLLNFVIFVFISLILMTSYTCIILYPIDRKKDLRCAIKKAQ